MLAVRSNNAFQVRQSRAGQGRAGQGRRFSAWQSSRFAAPITASSCNCGYSSPGYHLVSSSIKAAALAAAMHRPPAVRSWPLQLFKPTPPHGGLRLPCAPRRWRLAHLCLGSAPTASPTGSSFRWAACCLQADAACYPLNQKCLLPARPAQPACSCQARARGLAAGADASRSAPTQAPFQPNQTNSA